MENDTPKSVGQSPGNHTPVTTPEQLDGFFDTVAGVAKKVGGAIVSGVKSLTVKDVVGYGTGYTQAKEAISGAAEGFSPSSAAAALWGGTSKSFVQVRDAGAESLRKQGVPNATVSKWGDSLNMTGVGLAVCYDSINDPNPDTSLSLGREFAQALTKAQPQTPSTATNKQASIAAKYVYTKYKGKVLFDKTDSNEGEKQIKSTLGKFMPSMAEVFYAPFVKRLTGLTAPSEVLDPAGWPEREKARQEEIAALKEEIAKEYLAVNKEKAQAKLEALELQKNQNALYQAHLVARAQGATLKETAYRQQQQLSLQAVTLQNQIRQTQLVQEAQEVLDARKADKAKKVVGVALGVMGIALILYALSSRSKD